MDEYTVEQQKKILKSSYEMYEKTKNDTRRNMKEQLNSDGSRRYTDEAIEDKIRLISEAESDIIAQYKALGGTMEELETVSKKTGGAKKTKKKKEDVEIPDFSQFEKKDEKIVPQAEPIFPTETTIEQTLPKKGQYSAKEAFDVIKLPSRGEGYKSKKKSLPVAYLTAYDENMIVSPNLYRDNKVLDYILQEKIQNNEIDPMDLLEGDRDAIILFLRASGYGNDYPITATDDETGVEFQTNIDLSKLEYKSFTLTGDTNGWFEYTLPVSGDVVKFRFPTHRDIVTLQKMEEKDNLKIVKNKILEDATELNEFIDNNETLDKKDKLEIRTAINRINRWGEDLVEGDEMEFTHSITNRLTLLIMSINDITDKSYIFNYVKNMNVRDSSSLRRYMNQNEPGIDFTLEVEKPESLGGGSMKVFLQLDQYVFLNITE